MPIDKFRLDTIITAYLKEDECPRKERMLSMTSEEVSVYVIYISLV